MKKIILIILIFNLISCFDNKTKVIKIKVLDKSTYAYQTQNNKNFNKIQKNTQKDKKQINTKITLPPNNIKIANNNTLNNTSKTWIKPVNAPVLRPFGNGYTSLTYNTKNGMIVKAINDGKVVYSSGNLKSFGNMIIIKHKYGFYSHYMFNGNLLVNIGDTINKGDNIATTSKTKFALQMKKYTTIIDPSNYIK